MEKVDWKYDAKVVEQLLRGNFADDLKLQTQRILKTTLSPSARDLLYRMNIIGPVMSADDVTRVGELPPAIPLPLDTLADCFGVWIQRLPRDRFVVSPLVTQLGSSNIPVAIQRAIHLGKARAIAAESMNQVSALSAIYHFQMAGAAKEAAGVLLIALSALNDESAVGMSDFGILELWADSDFPAEIPKNMQLVTRSLQVCARTRHGKSHLGVLQRFDALLDECTSTEPLAAYTGCAMLAVVLANTDQRQAISYALKALSLESAVALELATWEMRLADVLWLASPSIKTPADLTWWLETVSGLTQEQRERLFGTDLAVQSARFICDGFWMREEDKTTREWSTLEEQLANLYTKSKNLNAHVLSAALTRARIVISADHEKNIEKASTLAVDAISSIDGNKSAEFLVSFTLGTSCRDAGAWRQAVEWLSRAIEAYDPARLSQMADFFVRACLGRGQAQGHLGTSGEEDYERAVRFARQTETVSDLMLIRALGEYSISLWEKNELPKFYELWKETVDRTVSAKRDSADWRGLFVLNGNNMAFFMNDAKGTEPAFTVTRPFQGMYLLYSPKLPSLYSTDTEWYLPAGMVRLAEKVGRYDDMSRWALQAVDEASHSSIGESAKFLLTYAVPQAIKARRYIEAIEFVSEGIRGIESPTDALVSWAELHGREEVGRVAREQPKARESIHEELLTLAIVPMLIDLVTWRIANPEAVRNAFESIADKCRERGRQANTHPIWTLAAERIENLYSAESADSLVARAYEDAGLGRSLAAIISFIGAADIQEPERTCGTWLSALKFFQTQFSRSPLHMHITAELVNKFWRTVVVANPMSFRQPGTLIQQLSALEQGGNYLPSDAMSYVVWHIGMAISPQVREWLGL
jgi:hypothetical protein